MNTIKFTSDGKKVAVVGKLNAQETIVQEIFIINESEIPSGENFVVKSLHDAPAISWKEKNLNDLDKRYDEERKRGDELEKKLRIRQRELQAKLEYIGSALKNADESSFTLLVDFICGNITHVVELGYRPKIMTTEAFFTTYDDRLRLVSIFGKDDGTFKYCLGQYYDYSGSNTTFIPCKNYNEAIKTLWDNILDKNVTSDIIKTAKEYNIVLDNEKIKIYKEESIKNIQSNIESQQKEIDKSLKSIEELNQLS